MKVLASRVFPQNVEGFDSEGLKSLIAYLHDELCTHLTMERKADPFVFITKKYLDDDERAYADVIGDEWSVSLDASFDRPHCRIPLGTFFCVYAPGTQGGMDPEIRRECLFSKEDDGDRLGFYFLPDSRFDPHNALSAEQLHYKIIITNCAEGRGHASDFLSPSFFSDLESKLREKRTRALEDFTGFYFPTGKCRKNLNGVEDDIARGIAELEEEGRKNGWLK